MNIARVLVLVAMLVIIEVTNGQRPDKCYCGDHTNFRTPCDTPGCSVGDNRDCSNYYAFIAGPLPSATDLNRVSYSACSCPGNSYTGRPTQGYYNAGFIGQLYNFTDCTAFGTVQLRDGSSTPYGDNAVNCCNYCCTLSGTTAATSRSTAATIPSTTSVTQTFTLASTTTRIGAGIYLFLVWLIYFGHHLTTIVSKREI